MDNIPAPDGRDLMQAAIHVANADRHHIREAQAILEHSIAAFSRMANGVETDEPDPNWMIKVGMMRRAHDLLCEISAMPGRDGYDITRTPPHIPRGGLEEVI